jgi:CheY-like chemotaxis protein
MTMPKVMLIEDDETMLALLQTLMEFEGFQVAHLNGDETIDETMSVLRQERPALLLLDVNLRRLDSFDLLHRIREDNDLKSIHVLMSSGMELSRQCRDEGADGFILKPYMPEELVGIIHRALGE